MLQASRARLAVLRGIEAEAESDSMIANMAITAQFVTGAALLRQGKPRRSLPLRFPRGGRRPRQA